MGTEVLFWFLETKQFRELETYIEKHNFDILTPVSGQLNEIDYENSPFVNVMSSVADLKLLRYIFHFVTERKNFSFSAMYWHERFMKACRSGSIDIVKFLVDSGTIRPFQLKHALSIMKLDFIKPKNKDEIMEFLALRNQHIEEASKVNDKKS